MSDSVERVIGNKKEVNLPTEGRGGEEVEEVEAVEVVEGNADVQSQPEQSTNTEPSSTDENSHLPNDKA
jgi:hypothetical protein